MVAKVKWGFIVGGNDGVEEVFGVGEIGGFENGLGLGLERVMGFGIPGGFLGKVMGLTRWSWGISGNG